MFILSKISFALVNDRARYTHFIESDGRLIAMYDLNRIREARVGVAGDPGRTDEQRLTIVHLAQLATDINPVVAVEFGEGTSPFPPLEPTNHPLTDLVGENRPSL